MISRFNGLIYNNIHKGKKGFVIGTGPSINKIEKSYINKLQKEITVGINHAYVLFNPTYLLWSDSFFWNHFNKDLINVNSIKLCPSELVLNGKIVMDNTYYLERKKDNSKFTLSFNDPFSFDNNSGVAGLRVAAILGLNPIYLIGIDLKKSNEYNSTHFHNKYHKRRSNCNSKRKYNDFFKSFKNTIEELQIFNIDVYSCSPSSKLNSIIDLKLISKILK